MQRSFWRVALLPLLLLALWPLSAAAQGDTTCFPETGQCISGRFREYWLQNGGLPVFGYPIGPAQQETNRENGQRYLTQRFERNRFELHPENARPYDVLLGRLGDDRLLQLARDWHAIPRESGPRAGCLWFEQTGFNVCDQGAGLGFRSYWQGHGLQDAALDRYNRSLALFGLPITPMMAEVNPTDGQTYLTQWFERARFEWHPNERDEYKVLLGLLGNEIGSMPTSRAAGSYPHQITAVGNRVFFTATDGRAGNELWVSDGTPQGTAMVRDIRPGSEGSNPFWITKVGNRVFFSANDGERGDELWASDGTAQGTYLVQDINYGPASSSPWSLTDINGALYFAANNGAVGNELWHSNGTNSGTYLVKDIRAGAEDSTPPIPGRNQLPNWWITNVNGTIYFYADDGIHGAELWRSNGTAPDTQLVVDMTPGSSSSALAEFVSSNGRLFLIERTFSLEGNRLWRADSAGAQMVRRFDLAIGFLTDVNGTLYFQGPGEGGGAELWRSDGSAQGTVQAAEIWPGPTGSFPGALTNYRGTLVFTAADADGRTGVWLLNNTQPGPQLLVYNEPFLGAQLRSQFSEAGGQLIWLERTNPDNRTLLWTSNGSRQTTLEQGGLPGSSQDFPSPLVSNGTQVFFSFNDGSNGNELWVSNGTPQGSYMVKDIYPGTMQQ